MLHAFYTHAILVLHSCNTHTTLMERSCKTHDTLMTQFNTHSFRLFLYVSVALTQHHRHEPPYPDLDSAPWSSNPILLQSAYKRIKKLKWKWLKIINTQPVKKQRKDRGFEAQIPLSEDEEAERIWREQRKDRKGKKKKAKVEQTDEDEEEDEDD